MLLRTVESIRPSFLPIISRNGKVEIAGASGGLVERLVEAAESRVQPSSWVEAERRARSSWKGTPSARKFGAAVVS